MSTQEPAPGTPSAEQPPRTPQPPAPPFLPPPPWGPLPAYGVRPPGYFRRGFAVGLGAALGAGLALTVVGVVMTVVMVLALVGLIAGSSGGSASELPTETVWGAPDATTRLVAVPVTGVILGGEGDGATFGGATYGYDVADTIDGLQAPDADGLILELNTPGGTIHGSRAIADAVERYQERTGNQVMAHVQGMSASGGVYAMAGADQIVVDHGSLVGSIGVIMGPFERFRDVTGVPGSLLDPGIITEGGITQEYLTRGRGKDLGNPYRDMTEEERAVLGRGMDAAYEDFVGWVSEQRDIPRQVIVRDLGAFVYDGRTAVERGLADRVLGREEAYRYAAEINELDPDDTRVDRLVGTGFVEALLGAQGPAGGVGAAAVAAEPGRSIVCLGGPLPLAYHGDLAAACAPR